MISLSLKKSHFKCRSIDITIWNGIGRELCSTSVMLGGTVLESEYHRSVSIGCVLWSSVFVWVISAIAQIITAATAVQSVGV